MNNNPRQLATDKIACISLSTKSAWFQELKKRPALLSTKDLCEVFGIGRTKAWSIATELGGIRVGRSVKIDRNTLMAYIVTNGRLP